MTKEIIQKIINDSKVRTRVAFQSHSWFFAMYFGHYIKKESPPFHNKLFRITEDKNISTAVIVSFRGSAKSTLMTLSYPIWAIIGAPQKKFIIIVGQTQRQAKQHLSNIKRELESNKLLRDDLGPFEEQQDEWGSYSLVMPKYGAKITAVSMEQTIRGLRHQEYRPDLIICDDIEDLMTVKTREGRNKIFNWITGEVIPAGDQNTKMIFIGNLLHEDSLLMRLKEKIHDQEIDGVYMEIPLIDDCGKVAWPGKYPDEESIRKEKSKIGNEIAWKREYLLQIVPDYDQIVHPEWIKKYDTPPDIKNNEKFRYSVTGIDLAVSQKETAHFTAMVSAHVFGFGEDLKIFILPNPVNERLTHDQTLKRAMNISNIVGNGNKTKIVVEDVGYQKSVIQELLRHKYPAESAYVHGQDKQARLSMVSHLIQDGSILFPKKGAERLIEQLVGFGVEKNDDLADAFSLLINYIINQNNKKPVMPEVWIL
ncbi:hypothetical protein ACFL1Y_01610 [Patescibacteria group bacterium]